VISAKKFRGDFEGFFKEVVKTWDEQWDAVYDSRTKETRPHHPKAQLVEYDTRALVVLLGSVGCMCALVALVVAAAAARFL